MRAIFKTTPSKYCFTLDYKNKTGRKIYENIKSLASDLNLCEQKIVINVEHEQPLNKVFEGKKLIVTDGEFYLVNNIAYLNYILDSEFKPYVKSLSIYFVDNTLLSSKALQIEKLEAESIASFNFLNNFQKSSLCLKRNKFEASQLQKIVTPYL